jgi:hypothetical protein
MQYPRNPTTGELLDPQAATNHIKQNGTNTTAKPPRNLQAKSGSRKISVFWDAPEVTLGIIGYKVYVDNENSLYDTIRDPNVRRYDVPASSGSTPPTKNIFISSYTINSESTKMQIQGAAIAEAGAPTDPATPPGSAASGDTGRSFGIDAGSDAGFTR